MRLSKIKLAGFKSFVDPTTIPLISNLTSVAGPNGCGKSNVIDAVRWVMGESSAKHLRGGAITDVIFSGSTARKPVGQATVELIFDNTDGKIGGEYASYAEIAVKRQVSRDGQSNYFLNGLRCRRKDITDLFLGTGLGPRSYAIIEQGMISRVIDAKPEELRVYIEEAAGISKYKERRRETENRIKHTQENLARLNDLRGELDSQLQRLHRQSQAALRYQELKAEEKQVALELAALTWERIEKAIQSQEAHIRDLSTDLAAKMAEIQHQKTQQEKLRLEYTDSNDALNEVQKHYYGLGAEIARIEQLIQHQQERHIQLLADKQEAEQLLAVAKAQMNEDREALIMLEESVAELLPQEDEILAFEQGAQQQLQACESALNTWRENLNQVQQQVVGPTRIAEAEKAKIEMMEKQIQQYQIRQQRLEEELKQLGAQEISEVESLDEKIVELELRIEEIDRLISETANSKEEKAQRQKQLQSKIKETEKLLNEMLAQQMALQTLQARALGQDEQVKTQWLSDQQLTENQYLAQRIQVKSGWECAVETVLAGFLQGLGLETAQWQSVQLPQHSDFALTLLAWPDNPIAIDNLAADCLVHNINNANRLPQSLIHVLSGVRTATTVDEARQLARTLAAHESIITPEGYWVGADWLRIPAQEDQEVGLLAREEKLKALGSQIQEHELNLNQLQDEFDSLTTDLKSLDSQRENYHQDKNQQQKDIITLQGEKRVKLNKIEQQQKRGQQIERDLKEAKDGLSVFQQETNQARSALNMALDHMAQFNDELAQLNGQKELLHDAVMQAKNQLREVVQRQQDLALKLQGERTQIKSYHLNIERFDQQIQSYTARLESITQSLHRNDEPVVALKNELQDNIEKRIGIEDRLNAARDQVAAVDNALRDCEKQLNQLDITLSKNREQLEQAKMSWQALMVRKESSAEKLKEIERIEDLVAAMPSEANETEWQERLTELEQKIQRLGAINLAAIEEYDAAKQRQEYMEAQLADLTEALTTLENAIKKIDKETRTKFKDTFDLVNNEFMRLFPKLFGGGQAELVLTGEDLLDTGIVLIARPPGKKNSSIQLLSGGEKALTAISLVFAIFRLNPAPFCMLDEVDAPLDDNNVGRFCNLVREMSETVQFIYISHNKITIEMAQQIHGVTMREPGVSRLVSVDIEEATSLATA